MNQINFNEHAKIRLRRNASYKHEIVKTLLAILLQEKYKSQSYWVRVYSEWRVKEGKICDIYFENQKTKEIIFYEIQEKVTPQWLEETQMQYDNVEVYLFKTDWQLIELKKLSDNIPKLIKQLKELII